MANLGLTAGLPDMSESEQGITGLKTGKWANSQRQLVTVVQPIELLGWEAGERLPVPSSHTPAPEEAHGT